MLSAYHGEFLKDFNVSHSSAFDAWLSDQRNLYQSQYLHQLLAAEKEAYYAGKLDLAEKYGTEYIAIDPLEESAFSTLMQVYRDQKKFRKALGLYHTLCKNLSDEFSISPLKETSALYYQIVDAWNTSTYKLEVGSDQQLIGKDAVLHKLVSLCNGSRLESDKICALIQGKPMMIERQGMLLDIPACLVVTAAALVPALVSGRFKRWMGFLIGGLYIAYLVIMFTCFGV